MRKMKQAAALFLIVLIVMGTAAGCSNNNNSNDNSSNKDNDNASNTDNAKNEDVYFLNFKPEIAEVYDKVAEDYNKETGNTVKVETAASGTYESTLKSEISKKDAPVIFQVNGPVGFQSWKDYCLDLSDTDLYKNLTDQSMAITEGDGVYAVPYAIEGYGIIYNKAIMDKYFELSDRKTKIDSTEEITNYQTLKEVAEDMQERKGDLGIDGVFASTSLNSGEQWRWQTHLANIPFYYEFLDTDKDADATITGLNAETVDFKYNENFKNIFDLYTENSTTEKGLLGSKSVDDSMAEFALGKAAIVQNGNWAWSQINEVSGNVVDENDIKYLPIYTGMDQDAEQGLAVGTENYLAINSKASEGQQKAAVDFLNWLFSSDTGKAYVSNELGFIAPFNTFSDDEKPADPLARQILAYTENEDLNTVPWVFSAFPSEEYKNQFGDALLEYAQGNKEWNDVVNTVKESWESERK